jgi:hypothetical protein
MSYYATFSEDCPSSKLCLKLNLYLTKKFLTHYEDQHVKKLSEQPEYVVRITQTKHVVCLKCRLS